MSLNTVSEMNVIFTSHCNVVWQRTYQKLTQDFLSIISELASIRFPLRSQMVKLYLFLLLPSLSSVFHWRTPCILSPSLSLCLSASSVHCHLLPRQICEHGKIRLPSTPPRPMSYLFPWESVVCRARISMLKFLQETGLKKPVTNVNSEFQSFEQCTH